MLYSYECPACGWKGDRVAKIADRNDQKCDQLVKTGDSTASGDDEEVYCAAPLLREEFALTARMPDQWKRGTK